ncbi:MFS transporter [Sphingomonadaceae bacterium OTU29MARTA1]|nr:MFS transporter [Sphingomonadaceae bacterium OTU29MARTA1]
MKDAASPAAIDLAEAQVSPRRYVFFAMIFIMYALSYADRAALSIALPELSREFALDPVQIGWVSSSFLWTYFLLNLPSTIVLDMVGARRVGSVAVALWSVAMVIGGLTQTMSQFVASRLLLGVGESPTFGVGAKVVRNWAGHDERGTVMTVLLTGIQLGLAFGTLAGAYLIVLFGWRVEFMALGAIGVIWAIAWYRLYRDPIVPATPGASRAISLANIRALFASRSFRGILVVQCTQNYLNFLIMSWAPLYLIHELNIDLKKTGSTTALCYLIAAIGAVVLCRIGERLVPIGRERPARRRFIVAAFLTGAASIGLLPWFHTMTPILIVMSGALCCLIAASGANTAMLTDLVDDGTKIGSVTGVTLTFSNLLGLLAPIVTGYIVAATDRFDLAWYLCSGALLVAGVLSILLVDRPIEMDRR